MKKLLRVMLCVMLALASTPVTPVSAATALTVDLGVVLRGVTHCASGSLYGITETKPADIANLVAPLKPAVFTNPARSGTGYQQPIGAAIPTAGRLTGTTGQVMIRLADIYPGWPYRFTTTADWLSKVSSVISDKKASGYSNFYGYEIWNEPDGTWEMSNGWNSWQNNNNFNNFWKSTYDLIRANDPNAKIVGPSTSAYNRTSMSSFLKFCIANNCLPDVIAWHELSGIQYVSNNLKDYRSLEASLGISERPISINEYCDTDHALEGQPGSSARYIGKFERYKVDNACISWWFTQYPGRLGSLLATDTQKGAGWYFYKWYGDMTGNMVSVTPPNDASNLVDGAACVDSGAQYISFIFGGNNDGTINTTFKNIPSFIGSTATVKVEKIDWTSKDTVSSGPVTVSSSNYTVSNGQITVSMTGCNNSSGYRIYITPGSGSSGTSYEAETGTALVSSVAEATNAGYTGSGYVNFNASSGASVEWSGINCSITGTKNLKIRYALASGTRYLDIYVNGTKVITNAEFTATGSWSSWAEKTVQVSMNSGTNTLKMVTTGTEGPNIDTIHVSASP